MPDRPGQSRALIATLLGDDPIAAEGAAARLVILGRPAVRNLVLALHDAPAAHVVRLLGVLERLGDPLAQHALIGALADRREDVAAAAAGALGVLLASDRTTVATAALDHLTAVTLDTARPRALRLAALEALGSHDPDVVAPVRAQLLSDADEAIRAAARGTDRVSAPEDVRTHPVGPLSPAAIVEAAASGTLPADAELLRQALSAPVEFPLPDLHRVVQHLVAAERAHPEMASGWRMARAAAHQALAGRHSRLAVYDLRETIVKLGAATPVGFLSALHAVGDTASLDAIVDAWSASDDGWFKGQLSGAFAAIVQREGLTRRHGAIRKLSHRAPAMVQALWPRDGQPLQARRSVGGQ